ncbi:hypothetical protein [Streptomyces sp. NPDC048277]|uniref:hypothetical protein n=1 Tax=Streptomyces sp. NPDC048277 TaxID=3155027 RepID=UPI00340CB374
MLSGSVQPGTEILTHPGLVPIKPHPCTPRNCSPIVTFGAVTGNVIPRSPAACAFARLDAALAAPGGSHALLSPARAVQAWGRATAPARLRWGEPGPSTEAVSSRICDLGTVVGAARLAVAKGVQNVTEGAQVKD